MSRRDEWTDEEDERLKVGLAKGLTTKQIGIELRRGRNAVIGRVNRRGFSSIRPVRAGRKPARPQQPRTGGAQQQKNINCKRIANHGFTNEVKLEPAPADEKRSEQIARFDAAIPLDQLRTLVELNEKTCRWPIGDRGPDHLFCGGLPEEGRPYCPGHCSFAYQPEKPRLRQQVQP
jgi:GcrA cell cycle regulator